MSDSGGHQQAEAERHLIGLLTGAWRTQAVSVAAQLGIADHIAAGHHTAAALAERVGTDRDRLRRLLRLLVSLQVVTGDDVAGYRLTGSGELLRTGVPGSMRDLCDIYGREFYTAWGSARDAIAEGVPGFERAHGRPLGEHLRADEDARSRFQRAMNAGQSFLDEVPARFDFSTAHTVVDVAGGAGPCWPGCCGAVRACAGSCSTCRTCSRWPSRTSRSAAPAGSASSCPATCSSPFRTPGTCTCSPGCCRTGRTRRA
ncbi:hypothetical protein GCM10022222_52440 [Amycolatopsis ultiminotia]|uniref:Uncharacterized protein n=1 Tax=Amycolatopsis ultiminotia TaxID=543629 RepID=A0ABP6X7B5_9PSEU